MESGNTFPSPGEAGFGDVAVVGGSGLIESVDLLTVCLSVCLSVYSDSLSEVFLHGVVWSLNLPRVCGCWDGG